MLFLPFFLIISLSHILRNHFFLPPQPYSFLSCKWMPYVSVFILLNSDFVMWFDWVAWEHQCKCSPKKEGKTHSTLDINVSLAAFPVHMVEDCARSDMRMVAVMEPEKGDSRKKKKNSHKLQMNNSTEQKLDQNSHLCSYSNANISCQIWWVPFVWLSGAFN